MTVTTDRDISDSRPIDGLQRRVRGLTATVIALAVALVGLGAWTIYGMTATPQNAITPEIQAALDGYFSAWNTYDGDAFQNMITDTFEYGFFGDEPWGDIVGMVTEAGAIDWQVKLVGEPIMIGADPWMVAATINVVSSIPHHNPPDGINMAAVFFLVDDGGTLKVTQHWVGGPGIAESD